MSMTITSSLRFLNFFGGYGLLCVRHWHTLPIMRGPTFRAVTKNLRQARPSQQHLCLRYGADSATFFNSSKSKQDHFLSGLAYYSGPVSFTSPDLIITLEQIFLRLGQNNL